MISDNILKAGGISLEGSTKSTCGLVLGGAHYNLIKNNYIEVDDANGIKLVKVSDETPKAEQLVGGTLSLKQGDMSEAISITDKTIDNLGNGNYLFGRGGFSINKAPANFVDQNTGAVLAVFPETGVYFGYVSDSSYISSLPLPAKSVIVRIPGELTNIVGGYVREEEGMEPLVDAVILAGCFKLYGGVE